jgi:large-conductance mechanosensitive channel
MEIIVDLFWFVVSAGLIYLYVRNTNKVVKELINELEHKRKENEQKTNNSND